MRRVVLALCLLAPAIGVVTTARAAEPPAVTQQYLRSFDGTPIFTTLFVPRGASATNRVPVVLRAHGWGGAGQTRVEGTLKALVDAGYAVLTWDARGFGRSGGRSHVDALDVEGRDVQTLVSWLATRSVIRTQGAGDPVVGMSGPSYGGAIQLAAAAIDRRIDAIAPEITWFDLRYSLFPNGVTKRGAWADALFASGFAARNATPEWLLARSLAGYGERLPIRAPTLVVQGTVDELFNVNEGVRVDDYLESHGVPHRFVVFCGGHGTCRHPGPDREHVDAAVVRWFDRWLRGRTDVDVGPPAEYRTNDGRWKGVDDFPPSDTRPLVATGAGNVTPPLSVPAVAAVGTPLDVVGLPRVSIDIHGGVPGGTLFVKLVDRETGEVLSNQEVLLPATSSHIEAELIGVAHTLAPGHHLDLVVRGERPAVVSIVATVPVRATLAA
jgi:ABC-2 type transport system ATP-binding protein